MVKSKFIVGAGGAQAVFNTTLAKEIRFPYFPLDEQKPKLPRSFPQSMKRLLNSLKNMSYSANINKA
jgi:hypothetical protein